MYFDMFGLSTLLAMREALGDSRLLPLRHEPRFVSMFQELELAISTRIEGSDPIHKMKFHFREISEENPSKRDNTRLLREELMRLSVNLRQEGVDLQQMI